MSQNLSTANELIESWQRYDWRESFFAPGLAILQALTRNGQTASGAGEDRDAAFRRCLGETAEILALARLDRATSYAPAYAPGRDGVAAHAEPDRARKAATLEALERFTVARWWSGAALAYPVAAIWITQAGLGRQLARMRQGAALKRRTDWWQIDTPGTPQVMICRSMSPEGQDPVFGYGIDPDPVCAAEKALRELLLMELNLMELLGARFLGAPLLDAARLVAVRGAIRQFALREAALFPDLTAIIPAPTLTAALPETRWFGAAIHQRQILLAAGTCVWLAQPRIPPPDFSAATGSPFL